MWLFIESDVPQRLESEYSNRAFSVVEAGTLIESEDKTKLIEDLPFTEDMEEPVYVEVPKDIEKKTYFITQRQES